MSIYQKNYVRNILKENIIPGSVVSSSQGQNKTWIQGFIVQISDNLVLLDDSTGLITVDLTNYRKKVNKDFVPLLGDYIMVTGKLTIKEEKYVLISHQCISIEDPNRMSLWNLEVIYLNS